MEGDVLNDAVALVENAKDSDALGHRSDSALAICSLGGLGSHCCRDIFLPSAFAARCERKRAQDEWNDRSHYYSGIQGS